MTILQRVIVGLALMLGSAAAYAIVGATIDPSQAYSLRTGFDDAVPFLPWTTYLYAWHYPWFLFPLFVIRDRALMRRVLLADLVVILASSVCFVAMPVSVHGLRPQALALNPDTFHTWATLLVFELDTPNNLFPSMHLSLCTLTALSAWSTKRSLGAIGLASVAAVAISIATTKQHYLADGVAGLALGTAAWAALVRKPASRLSESERSLSWRGLAAFAGFAPLPYLVLYAVYASGIWPLGPSA